jgi:hypothetical protein
MTKLSLWAKYHPSKARIVIVLLHLLLNMLAVYTGIALLQPGLTLAAPLVYLAILLFFTTVLLYPGAKQTNKHFTKRHLYLIRKSFDVILAACSFLLVCFTANEYLNNNVFITAFTAGASVNTKDDKKQHAAEILASLTHRNKNTLTRSEKRILKNEFRRQLKVYIKAKLMKDDEEGSKALLIILAIIGAIGLTLLLGALACSIACNGSEAIAVLVGILGLTAIVFLLIVVIKKIKEHKKEEKATPRQ